MSAYSDDSNERPRKDRGWSRKGEEDRRDEQRYCANIKTGEHRSRQGRNATIEESRGRQDRNRVYKRTEQIRRPYSENEKSIEKQQRKSTKKKNEETKVWTLNTDSEDEQDPEIFIYTSTEEDIDEENKINNKDKKRKVRTPNSKKE